MSKLKKVLLMGLSLVLVAALAIGGTVAYLQDSDSDVNVMTLGNVTIEQLEYERVVENGEYKTDTIGGATSYVLKDFTQGKPLLPATVLDANGQPYNNGAGNYTGTLVMFEQVGANGGGMDVFTSENAQDKFVFVKNTGKTDAYVRTLVAFEAGSLTTFSEWHALISTSYHFAWQNTYIGIVEIDGNNYVLFEYVYAGRPDKGYHIDGVLPAGEVTQCSLAQVYMKAAATNEDMVKLDGNKNGTYDILVASQAVQTAGFADAWTALNAGFGEITTTNHPWSETAPVIPAVVSSVEELRSAIADGGDVILSKDIEMGDAQLTVPAGVTTTLNLNGHALTGSYTGSDSYSMFKVFNGASLTVTGEGEVSAKCNGGTIFSNEGNLTLNSGTYNMAGGNWFNQQTTTIINNLESAIVTVNGGDYSVSGYAKRLFVNDATLNIYDGTFNAHPEMTYTGIYNRNGNLNIYGGTYDYYWSTMFYQYCGVVYEDYNGQTGVYIADDVIINPNPNNQ